MRGHFHFGLTAIRSGIVFECRMCYHSAPSPADRGSYGGMQAITMKRDQDRTLFSVLVLAAVLLLAASNTRLSLSPAEEHLAAQIGFEKDILGIVKNEAPN